MALVLLGACTAPVDEAPTTSLRLPTRAALTPSPAATPADPEPYFEAGVARQAAGETEEALRYFTWAIEADPSFVPAYVRRGGIYFGLDQLDLALDDAQAAIRLDPANGAAHVLRGEVLRLRGQHYQAAEAFDRAVEHDPSLREETFGARWQVARVLQSSRRLAALSREYSRLYPDDPVRHYYQAWMAIVADRPEAAINLLTEEIATLGDPPAILWYVLGEAYAARGAWSEAVTSFEATRQLVAAGDNSLLIHTDRPVVDLFTALGVAYLRVGRCVDAVSMLEYAAVVGAAESTIDPLLEEARLCQTPTPTFTPYPTTTPSR